MKNCFKKQLSNKDKSFDKVYNFKKLLIILSKNTLDTGFSPKTHQCKQ